MIQPPSNLTELRAAWRAVNDVDPDASSFRMEAAAEPRVYVHGMIGGYRLNAGTFVQAVHALTADIIHLHINSVGGFVWDAVSMYEALLEHPAKVVTHVDGIAASAASFLALAGDERRIGRAARMMIHDAQGITMGSPAQMRAAAELGDSISDDIAGLYAARAGGKPARWRAAMTRTTWYSSAQAVTAGLMHSVTGDSDEGPDNRTRTIQARHRALTTQRG